MGRQRGVTGVGRARQVCGHLGQKKLWSWLKPVSRAQIPAGETWDPWEVTAAG